MSALSRSTLRRVSLALAALTLVASVAANAQVTQGSGATADATSIAIGDNSTASNTSAAIGANSTATGIDSTAVGALSKATGQNSGAFGYQANASASGAYAIGYGAGASGVGAYAIGSGASATGSNAYSIGTNSLASGDYGLSFGMGANVVAAAANGIAMGQSAGVYTAGSIAIGATSMVFGTDGVALGYNAMANGAYGVALGYQANASQPNSVALGNGSTTYSVTGTSGMTIRGSGYTFAGATPTGSVSVGTVGGERTITNLAAGQVNANSTDAVNGSQLYAATQAIEALTSASNLVAQPSGVSGTITVGASTGGTSVDISGTSGARTLTGVAAGVGNTDAVNVSQLNAAIANVTSATSNAVAYDNPLKTSVTLGGVGATTPVIFTNVAPGALTATSTDAVNGSQLYATNQAVSALGNRVSTLEASAGTSSGVSAAYVQQQVSAALTSANSYTDQQSSAAVTSANGYTDQQTAKIPAGGSGSGDAATVLQSANTYTDQRTAAAVSQSKTYTDQQAGQTLSQSKSYTDQQVGALSSSVDQQFDAVNQGMNDLAKRIDGVGAMSAAAASAMYNPDSAHDTQAAIGIANFRGQFGYSVKVFHRFSPSAVVNLNVGGATGAAGVAVGTGINIGF